MHISSFHLTVNMIVKYVTQTVGHLQILEVGSKTNSKNLQTENILVTSPNLLEVVKKNLDTDIFYSGIYERLRAK